jgi:RNA polymerase sigma-70 factor (ECF subfamily)
METRAIRTELKEALEAAIAALDEESRTAVVLRDLAGESYEDIAAALGLPLGTVKSRIHRARLELRERLRPLL